MKLKHRGKAVDTSVGAALVVELTCDGDGGRLEDIEVAVKRLADAVSVMAESMPPVVVNKIFGSMLSDYKVVE